MKHFAFVILATFLTAKSFAQMKVESLVIDWPADRKWKTLASHNDKKTGLLEMIPENEKADDWKMFITMMSFKDIKVTSTNKVVQTYKESSRKESPRAKLTVLEKNDTTAHKWTIFKIETESFPEDPRPESQLYYAVQGESTLYVNFVAIREKELSDEFVNKWTKIFKSSEFVYKEPSASAAKTTAKEPAGKKK